jgi:hypothetical protein
MEKAATERADGVRRWSAADGKWAENGKKMLFRGNEPKDLLKTKDLAFFGAQNELVFGAKRTVLSKKYGRECTRCTVIPQFRAP